MAGFRVIKDLNDARLEKLPVSSQTLSVGDLIELTAGSANWAATTSSTNHFTPKAIAMEAVTSSATQVLAYLLDGDEFVAVESANTANTSHNGDRMALTDKNTVNNSGSDATGQAVAFVQTGTSGAAGSTTEIVGHVLVGNGVDPDAA